MQEYNMAQRRKYVTVLGYFDKLRLNRITFDPKLILNR